MDPRSFNALFGRKPLIAVLHLLSCLEEKQKRLLLVLDECRMLIRYGYTFFLVENYDYDSEDVTFELSHVVGELKREFPKAIFGVKTKSDVHLPDLSYERNGAQFVQLDHVTGTPSVATGTLGEFKHKREFDTERLKYPSVVILGGIHPECYTLKNSTEGNVDGDCRKPHALLVQSCVMATSSCNAVVLTGGAVRGAVKEEHLQVIAKQLNHHPLVIGSGLSDANAHSLLALSSGALVGSSIREQGVASRVSPRRAEKLLEIRERVLSNLD